jgi:N-acetylglutamate synthase-like GNAT family acetyltransferase
MEVGIGRYEPADHEGVVALILDIQRNEFHVPITLDEQPDLRDMVAYGEGHGGFWVAREGAAIVGTVGLIDCGEGLGALRKMFVRRDLRGSSARIAARLFDALLQHAHDAALRTILLGTRSDMRAAHRFYDKRGFQRVGEAELPAHFPRMHVDTVFYRLALCTEA